MTTTRRSSSRAGIFAGAIATTLLLTACSGGNTDAESTAPTGEKTEPQTLKVAFSHDSENYDPQQPPQTVTRLISRQITDTLTEQDPKTGEILPHLATEWEISEDASTFTFTLRQDVTFSDGTPFNAEVVKNNFDRIIELGALSRVAGGQLRGYQSAEAVDEYTVRVTFDGPNAQFLQATASQPLGILAQATLELSPEEAAAGNVIGTGPYTLESYSPDSGIVLKAREDYAWPSPIYTNSAGEAYFDTVEISFVKEPTTIAGSLTGKQLDLAFEIDPASVSTVDASSTAYIEQLPTPGISIPLLPLPQSEVLSDVKVRQALNHATDRETIVKTVYQGLNDPATSVLSPITPYYTDLSEYLTFDVDKANQLLDEAGWTERDSDGFRTKDDKRLSIETKYSGAGTSTELLLQALQAQWKTVGLEFVLTPVQAQEIAEFQLHTYPFDITTWSQGRAEPDVLRTVFSSFYEGQSVRFDNADEELDELLVALQSATGDDRAAAAESAQRDILEKGYALPIYDPKRFIGVSNELQSFNVDIEAKPIFYDLSK